MDTLERVLKAIRDAMVGLWVIYQCPVYPSWLDGSW